MTYSVTLTNAGAALYAAALISDTPIQLSTMAVGDGGGSPVVAPDPTRTTLVNQVYSTSVSALFQDPNTASLMWAGMIIPPSIGGFTIREVGLFTSDGTLFAISNYPDTIKAIAASGITTDMVINIGMLFSNTALVTLDIDPSVVAATRAWVLATITAGYIVPGGTAGQVLKKNSSTAGDFGWEDPSKVDEYLVDSGTANTYVVTSAPVTSAYTNGMQFKFKIAHACTGASTFNAGPGAVPLVRDDGGATQAGDLPIGTLATVTYDSGTSSFILASVVFSQFGTAAHLNSSDQLGGVSAMQIYAGNPNGHVSGNAAGGGLPPSTCWDSVDNFVWYCTTTGSTSTAVWVAVGAQSGGVLISTSGTIQPGIYYVDTSGSAITLTLSSSLVGAYTFYDVANYWNLNNLTINGNGHSIGVNYTDIYTLFIANGAYPSFNVVGRPAASTPFWGLF